MGGFKLNIDKGQVYVCPEAGGNSSDRVMVELPRRGHWRLISRDKASLINLRTSEVYDLEEMYATGKARLEGRYPDFNVVIENMAGQEDKIPLKIDFDHFKEHLANHITDYFSENLGLGSGRIVNVNKSGLGNMTGIIVRPQREGVTAVPCIYIDSAYQQYLEYEVLHVNDIVEKLAYSYLEAMKGQTRMDPDFINQIASGKFTWDAIKSEVMLKAVPVTDNEAFLETVPHQIQGDIAAVYYLDLAETQQGSAAITINNIINEYLGIDMKELHETAVRNTSRRYPLVIRDLEDILASMGILSEPAASITAPRLYVLTNERQQYGAAAAFFPDTQSKVAKVIQEDFYILPSSIHELMAVKKNTEASLQELNNMIRDINEEFVVPEERLSDLTHEYNPKTGKIQVAEPDIIKKDYEKEQNQQRKL